MLGAAAAMQSPCTLSWEALQERHTTSSDGIPTTQQCSDWEHVTVRLTPDGREVTGVYYSCHRSAFCLQLGFRVAPGCHCDPHFVSRPGP